MGGWLDTTVYNSPYRTILLLTLSPTAPFAPPCPTALDLIGPRKKKKKTGFDDVS